MLVRVDGATRKNRGQEVDEDTPAGASTTRIECEGLLAASMRELLLAEKSAYA
jgi:hypothetical protein